MKNLKAFQGSFSKITLLVAVFVFSSCEDSHIKGVGEIITETRNMNSFHSIHVSDNIDIDLVFNEGNTGKIEIQGGKNLIAHVRTEVVDSVLYIGNENRFNWLRSYEKSEIKMKVYCGNLKFLSFDGVKTLSFVDTLYTNIFEFEAWGAMGFVYLKLVADSVKLLVHTGAPDIFLDGNTNYFYLYTHAHGNIKANDFVSQNLRVHSKGTANCYVCPVQTLGTTIESFGNVFYRNNPQILWNIETHEGRLIKID